MSNVAPLIPVLVVGGEHRFVVEKIEAQLRRHGMTVAHHWEWNKKPRAFVDRIEVVLILIDMVSHSMNDKVRELAHERGIPVVFGCRKWATNKDRLERAGYPEIGAEAPFPPPALSTPEASPSPKTEAAPIFAVQPEPPKKENVLTDTLPYDKQKLTQLYRDLLKEKPDISNDLAHKEATLRAPLLGFKAGAERPDLLADIRRDMGIIRPKNTAVRPVFSSPKIETVPTSEVPPEVLAATPANVQRSTAKSAPTDVKELVQLLRVAMEAEGIEALSITKDSVKFRRVVIEEGAFDV